ncbi:MAG TPA: TIR domain-containing protein [Candidatus Saccharibacteria bacterium]|nr:TIR domain-containing protein [Candidatus Saccharibacteria bacterium]
MARKVFFSFHYARDAWRVAQVRNSNVITNLEKSPFYDKAEWESIKRNGDQAVKNWIDKQLAGTSVTVVLIGKETASRKWVKYEIQKSIELGKGLLGVHISGIKDQNGDTDTLGANPLPTGYPVYKWNANNGAANLGKWIEDAAVKAGK